MPTQSIVFKAQFKFPVAVDVSSMGWAGIFSAADGSSSSLGVFALGQDMNNALARAGLFAQILNTLSGFYTNTIITTQTEVWDVGIGGFNIWTVDIVGTADDPAGVYTVIPTYWFTAGGQNLVYSTFFGPQVCPECPPSVNPEDATDCPTCYQDEVPFCDTPITILGLEDSTQYNFSIKDNLTGKIYTYTATTDSNGEADITVSDFPTGLFTPYNGPFTITIFDANGDPVVLTYGYVNYSCVEVTITNSTDYTP